jgi:hypothetical protein
MIINRSTAGETMNLRVSTICFVLIYLTGCTAPLFNIYEFQNGEFSSHSHSKIISDPGYGKGAIMILKLDGRNTKILHKVSGERRKQEILNMLLRWSITVNPGKHKVGVGYIFVDAAGALGVLVASKRTRKYESLYIRKEDRGDADDDMAQKLTTIWHFEEFELSTKKGMTYKLGHEYNETTERVQITVKECTENSKCSPINISTISTEDNAYPGWPLQRILEEFLKRKK